MKRIVYQELPPAHHRDIVRLGGDVHDSQMTKIILFETKYSDTDNLRKLPTVWFEVQDKYPEETIRFMLVTVVETTEPYENDWHILRSYFDRPVNKVYHLIGREEFEGWDAYRLNPPPVKMDY